MIWSKSHSLHCLPLIILAGFFAGCASDSARPGTVCGHCDYRFGRLTPNPCDECVPEVILPGYGYTPTSWQVWSEAVVPVYIEPASQSPPVEEVPGPSPERAEPPQEPMPPTSGMLPPNHLSAEAGLPDYSRTPTLLR
jgi:hypothetical protein